MGAKPRSWLSTVNILLLALVVVLIAARRDEIVRRLTYQRDGTVSAEGVIVGLPPDDPFLEYLLDHGSRDTESTLTSAIRGALKPGDTFIDVGANIGWYTLIAAKIVGPRGRVIAFEPEPRNFALLKRNVEINQFKNVILEQKAVSDRPGKLKLNLSATNENHSIARLGDQRGFIEVDAVRLDDYLEGYEGAIRCIKIDTEGAEGFIIAGMPETLKRNVELFLEFDPFLLKAAGTDTIELFERLRSSGFQIHRIDEQAKAVIPIDETPRKSGNLFLSKVTAATRSR